MAALLRRTLVLLLTTSALVATAPADTQEENRDLDPASLSAMKILLTMRRVYANCGSYRDTGEVVTQQIIEGGRAGGMLPFATTFERTGPFRFQFTDRGLGGEREARYLVWSEGAEVRSWWDAQPGVRQPASLVEALEVAAGISSGASLRIPGMLLRGLGQGGLLIEPERLADDSERGVACFLLRGRSKPVPYTMTSGTITVTVEGETVKLWIERESFLLRRVEENRTLTTYRSVVTTTYDPEMNIEIPAEELAFDPPETPIPNP